MPTYEYACRACGEHHEVVQAFNDDPLTVCPKCGGELRKVFGSVGIVFKGSGFYKTDSRSTKTSVTPPGGSESTPAAASTTSGSDTPASSNGSSDSAKPATPAPATPTPASTPAASGASSSSSPSK